MDKGLIIKRFGDRLNPQIINSVIKEFEFIREKVYLNGNPTEIVSQYLNFTLHLNSSLNTNVIFIKSCLFTL